ncbi:hypothetical protein [Bacillus sp. FJAT-22090]|uniref:hypothetical protein n=1 Tax=Bacillus sp. FJAT-22090 TaxID=1581038 RepID=UPI0011A9B8BC|nr:hypothetical protein [Bacillus sp. FJAT-22090]
MKRRLITIVLTLLVLIGLSFGIAYFTHTTFIDYSFLIGLAATVSIWFFNSKGGFGSRRLNGNIQGSTGIRMENKSFEFAPNYAFFTSLVYTIITIAAVFYNYRSYF